MTDWGSNKWAPQDVIILRGPTYSVMYRNYDGEYQKLYFTITQSL